MRVAIAWFAVAAVGLIGGIALSRWEYTRETVNFGPLQWDLDASAAVSIPTDVPRAAVVGRQEYDFGTMPHGSTGSHTFVIRNDGTRPLSLDIAETTCQCTVGTLESGQVAPGDSTQVTLTWTAEEYDPDFRQSATLRTNDPRQPSILLSIAGRVSHAIRPRPSSLAFSDVSRTETRQASLRVYSYVDEPLVVRSIEFERAATAEHFEATVDPVADEQLPPDPNLTSGVHIAVRMLPGLPLGPVRQRMHIEFESPKTDPLVIPIQGQVVSDVSILSGPNFDRDLQLLRLGRIPQAQGKTVTLHVLVKGHHAEQIELAVGEVDPADVLKAELGPPRSVGEAGALIYPLAVEVPPGSRPVSRLGSDQEKIGRVVLTMTHTDASELVLRVAFVVLGQ